MHLKLDLCQALSYCVAFIIGYYHVVSPTTYSPQQILLFLAVEAEFRFIALRTSENKKLRTFGQ